MECMFTAQGPSVLHAIEVAVVQFAQVQLVLIIIGTYNDRHTSCSHLGLQYEYLATSFGHRKIRVYTQLNKYRLYIKGEVAKSLGNQTQGVQPACTMTTQNWLISSIALKSRLIT